MWAASTFTFFSPSSGVRSASTWHEPLGVLLGGHLAEAVLVHIHDDAMRLLTEPVNRQTRNVSEAPHLALLGPAVQLAPELAQDEGVREIVEAHALNVRRSVHVGSVLHALKRLQSTAKDPVRDVHMKAHFGTVAHRVAILLKLLRHLLAHLLRAKVAVVAHEHGPWFA